MQQGYAQGLFLCLFIVKSSEAVEEAVVITTWEGELSSPEYPTSYPPNISLVWRLSVAPGNRIEITFHDLELNCNGDYLEIREGVDTTSPLSARLCGNQRPPSHISSGSDLLLHFFTDDIEDEQRGFALHHSGVCTVHLNTTSGVITTPNYPSIYPTNIDCLWTIELHPALQITLVFHEFALEEKEGCIYDYVEVLAGVSADSPVVARYCGLAVPPTFVREGNISIRFVSDPDKELTGFRCTYSIFKVKGYWTEWTAWNECSQTCHHGNQTRSRMCVNPLPGSGYELFCDDGDDFQGRSCLISNCTLVDGGYTQWSEWSECNVSCGTGVRNRSRTCTSPPPAFGGKNCTDVGEPGETTECVLQPCPGQTSSMLSISHTFVSPSLSMDVESSPGTALYKNSDKNSAATDKRRTSITQENIHTSQDTMQRYTASTNYVSSYDITSLVDTLDKINSAVVESTRSVHATKQDIVFSGSRTPPLSTVFNSLIAKDNSTMHGGSTSNNYSASDEQISLTAPLRTSKHTLLASDSSLRNNDAKTGVRSLIHSETGLDSAGVVFPNSESQISGITISRTVFVATGESSSISSGLSKKESASFLKNSYATLNARHESNFPGSIDVLLLVSRNLYQSTASDSNLHSMDHFIVDKTNSSVWNGSVPFNSHPSESLNNMTRKTLESLTTLGNSVVRIGSNLTLVPSKEQSVNASTNSSFSLIASLEARLGSDIQGHTTPFFVTIQSSFESESKKLSNTNVIDVSTNNLSSQTFINLEVSNIATERFSQSLNSHRINTDILHGSDVMASLNQYGSTSQSSSTSLENVILVQSPENQSRAGSKQDARFTASDWLKQGLKSRGGTNMLEIHSRIGTAPQTQGFSTTETPQQHVDIFKASTRSPVTITRSLNNSLGEDLGNATVSGGSVTQLPNRNAALSSKFDRYGNLSDFSGPLTTEPTINDSKERTLIQQLSTAQYSSDFKHQNSNVLVTLLTTTRPTMNVTQESHITTPGYHMTTSGNHMTTQGNHHLNLLTTRTIFTTSVKQNTAEQDVASTVTFLGSVQEEDANTKGNQDSVRLRSLLITSVDVRSYATVQSSMDYGRLRSGSASRTFASVEGTSPLCCGLDGSNTALLSPGSRTAKPRPSVTLEGNFHHSFTGPKDQTDAAALSYGSSWTILSSTTSPTIAVPDLPKDESATPPSHRFPWQLIPFLIIFLFIVLALLAHYLHIFEIINSIIIAIKHKRQQLSSIKTANSSLNLTQGNFSTAGLASSTLHHPRDTFYNDNLNFEFFEKGATKAIEFSFHLDEEREHSSGSEESVEISCEMEEEFPDENQLNDSLSQIFDASDCDIVKTRSVSNYDIPPADYEKSKRTLTLLTDIPSSYDI